jgi:hypothetical protein
MDMSLLYGIYAPDAGVIELGGRPLRLKGPADRLDAGISLVHQQGSRDQPPAADEAPHIVVDTGVPTSDTLVTITGAQSGLGAGSTVVARAAYPGQPLGYRAQPLATGRTA